MPNVKTITKDAYEEKFDWGVLPEFKHLQHLELANSLNIDEPTVDSLMKSETCWAVDFIECQFVDYGRRPEEPFRHTMKFAKAIRNNHTLTYLHGPWIMPMGFILEILKSTSILTLVITGCVILWIDMAWILLSMIGNSIYSKQSERTR